MDSLATKTIWKIQIGPDTKSFELPAGSKMLSVNTQHGVPCIWALVGPDEPPSNVKIHIAATGQDLPKNLGPFLGTFLVGNDNLVFHVFELH